MLNPRPCHWRPSPTQTPSATERDLHPCIACNSNFPKTAPSAWRSVSERSRAHKSRVIGTESVMMRTTQGGSSAGTLYTFLFYFLNIFRSTSVNREQNSSPRALTAAPSLRESAPRPPKKTVAGDKENTGARPEAPPPPLLPGASEDTASTSSGNKASFMSSPV